MHNNKEGGRAERESGIGTEPEEGPEILGNSRAEAHHRRCNAAKCRAGQNQGRCGPLVVIITNVRAHVHSARPQAERDRGDKGGISAIH